MPAEVNTEMAVNRGRVVNSVSSAVVALAAQYCLDWENAGPVAGSKRGRTVETQQTLNIGHWPLLNKTAAQRNNLCTDLVTL